MNKEEALEIINGGKLITINPKRFDYEIKSKPISYLEANTLEKRELWYKENYPQHPDKLSHYLARSSLGDPITIEEIERKKKSEKNNLEAEQRRLKTLAKTKEKRANKNKNRNPKKKNPNEGFKIIHGDFTCVFE
jgi:hypothetical protein